MIRPKTSRQPGVQGVLAAEQSHGTIADARIAPMLLTEVRAAEFLAISARSLWTLRNTGRMPFVRIHSSIRYRVADLEAFAAQQLVVPASGGDR